MSLPLSQSHQPYTSLPTHARTPSDFPEPPSPHTPTDPSAPFIPDASSPSSNPNPQTYTDDLTDSPPQARRSSILNPLPLGAQPPSLPGARDSVASSLGTYGYPAPGGTYRNSEYSSSTRALNPGALAYQGGGYRDDPSSFGAATPGGGVGTPYYSDDGSKPGTPMIPLGASRSDELDGSTMRGFGGAGAGGDGVDGAGGAGGYYTGTEKPLYGGKKKRTWWWWLLAAAVLAIIVVAVIVPVYFLIIKPHSTSSSSSHSGSSGSSSGTGSSGGNTSGGQSTQPAPAFSGAITGGDGSTVTRDDGTTFTYTNPFGGWWYFDPSDPFNDGAKAQAWTPGLNESWRWGVDQVRGVNIGGWLVTEPFIVPALYEPYQSGDFASPYNAVDEWTLTVAMNKTGNATALMEEHYRTFITEDDFAAIAAAGLNWVRIPIPYWAIEVYPGEPFVPHLAWQYFLKAIQWARKYGLRINMDLHTIPGSQNGWNHSGKLGPINFLFGVMGIANAQRALAYIRTLTEFVSQSQYKNVVQYFGIVNEAFVQTIGQSQTETFYLEAYNMIRNITGVGEGNGPFIGIHDGFIGMDKWAGFLQGSDRIAMDTHPYNAFNDPSTAPLSSFIPSPCQGWGPQLNTSMTAFGFSHAGEWSAAINDCGKWVNGVGLGTRYEGTYQGSTTVIGNCSTWTQYWLWSSETKQQTKELVMSSMDALQHWFFWTWKIGNSSISGNIEAPSWSYSLGLAEGWIPADPREAVGFCEASAGVSMTLPVTGLESWQTGGAGAGTIAADQLESFGVWPITSMASVSGIPYINPASVSLLPQYTPTGDILTLPGPTFTTPSSTQTADAGSGWADSSDTQGYYVPIEGCPYPDPWNAQSTTIPPASECRPTATAGKRGLEVEVERAGPTPPPVMRFKRA